MNKKPIPKDTYGSPSPGKRVHYYDFFIQVMKYFQVVQPSSNPLRCMSSEHMLKDDRLWIWLSGAFKIPMHLMKDFYYDELRFYMDFLSRKPEFTNTLIPEKYPSSLLSDDSGDSDSDSEDDPDLEGVCLICKKNSDPENTLLCDSCDKPFHTRCLSPPLSKIPKDNWYCDNCVIGNGYYGFKDSSIRYSLDDFKSLSDDFDKDYFKGNKPDDINVLEKMFWGLVNNTDNDLKVMYGADIHNLKKGEVSGFPTKEYIPNEQKDQKEQYDSYVDHPMNLNNLPYNKESLLNYLDVDISGMTIPWIYIGNTFSTFCWHVEDQYTLSANYQHTGAVKKWYSIPANSAEQFETYMKNLAPDLFAKQPDILHQLITLVSPYDLINHGINCYTTNQRPGEYVITYPRVYHAGFNAGFNFNEAVNFTMTDWLDFGVLATDNYKQSVGKISVFDIYEMITNILKSFLDEDSGITDLKLIAKCLKYLKPRLSDEYSIQATILEKLNTKAQKHKKTRVQKIDSDEDFEEDGVLCSECKGFCSFAYIKHYEPITTIGVETLGYLPSPRSSPVEEESKRRSSKRLKVKKDNEDYKTSTLCLNDYLKKEMNKEKDEFFEVKDKEEIKILINEIETFLNRV